MSKKLLLTLLTASCFLPTAQSQNMDFSYNGHSRTCIIHLPSGYSDTVDYPLVLNLHGYGSNAGQQQVYSGMNSVADTAKFIVAYPNAFNGVWDTSFTVSSVDDPGYFNALMDSIMANYSVNEHRVYSTGFSMGGFMTYRLATELSGRLAAVASVSGPVTDSVLYFGNSALMLPVMHIHGTADSTIPYAGEGIYLDIDTTINYFINRNNCNATPDTATLPDINTGDNCTVKSFCWSCNDTNEVLLYKVIGGEHTWPGSFIPIGVTNQDIKASGEIWKFFYRHQREHISLLGMKETARLQFNLYPNPARGSITVNTDVRSEKYEVRIMNTMGQLVSSSVVEKPKSPIDISSLSDGIYFLHLQGEEGVGVKRFEVQR